MPQMTHSAIPDQVIEVPAVAVSYWQSRGWATTTGQVVTPRGRVAPPTVSRIITHPSLPGRSARIPFATVPTFWSNLGWV